MGRKTKRRSSQPGGTVAFLILCVLAVIVGYFLGKFLIESLAAVNKPSKPPSASVSSSKEPSSSPRIEERKAQQPDSVPVPSSSNLANTVEVDVPGFSAYFVQEGAFESLENATRLARELSSKGFPALVFKADKHYVYSGVFFDNGLARQAVDQVKQARFDAFVASKQLESRILRATLDDNYRQIISSAVRNVRLIIDKEISIWEMYFKKDFSALGPSSSEVMNIAGGTSSSLASLDVPPASKELYNEVNTLVSDAARSARSFSMLSREASTANATQALADLLRLIQKYGTFGNNK